MRACTLSPQEEEVLALAAVSRLGEATAHQVAEELGVEVIRHTLGRLVDSGRLVKRRDRNRVGNGDVWVYASPRNGNGYCERCGAHRQVFGAKWCRACHLKAAHERASAPSKKQEAHAA